MPLVPPGPMMIALSAIVAGTATTMAAASDASSLGTQASVGASLIEALPRVPGGPELDAPEGGDACDTLDQNSNAEGLAVPINGVIWSQSFVPTLPTLCGVRLVTLSTVTELRVELRTSLPGDGGTVLTEGTALNALGEVFIDFDQSVPVSPGTTYFLTFGQPPLGGTISAGGGDEYPAGVLYAFGDPVNGGVADLDFSVYGTPPGPCGPVDVESLPVNGFLDMSQDWVQSFVPAADVLCGTRFSVLQGNVKSLTVELWTDLPGNGGVKITEGTVDDVPGIDAFVPFDVAAAVQPGQTYFLRPLVTPAQVFTLLFSTLDSYPDGTAYRNGSTAENFDFGFSVYGSSTAPPCDVVDQSSPETDVELTPFLGGLTQSFTATSSSLCGASVWRGSEVQDEMTITMQLYDGLPWESGVLMAETVAFDVPLGGRALGSFGDDVPVVPGQTYYLAIYGDKIGEMIRGATGDPYPGGIAYRNSGEQSFPDQDYAFAVYGAPAVPCSSDTVDQPLQGLGLPLSAFIAQSFTLPLPSVCGASVLIADILPEDPSDISVSIWTDLPTAGGIELARGVDYGVSNGDDVVVNFGRDVPIGDDGTYYLVVESSRPEMFLAATNFDSFPDGLAYFGSTGYVAQPEIDLTFSLFIGGAPPCPADCAGGDGVVDFTDLLSLLSSFGGPGACDINADGTIDFSDVLAVLAAWGTC